jgi:hypothetical protein
MQFESESAMARISEKVCRMGFGIALCAIALMGCKAGPPAGVAVVSDNSETGSTVAGDGPSGSSTAPGGTQVKYINDPSLELNAVAVTMPAGWKFQSVFMQGGTCVPTPFGVYRTASPDGWSMVERMPSLAWMWGQGPMVGYSQKNDCLPMRGPMSAQDFLHYLSGTMGVHYDGPAPVPAAEANKAQQQLQDSQQKYAAKFAAIGAQQPRQTRELARAMVSYKIGDTAMKGMLDVTVDCTETLFAGQPGLSAYSPGHPPQMVTGASSTVDKCVASTNYYTAPENKLAALVERWDSTGLGTKPEDAWFQAWVNRSNEQTRVAIGEMNAAAQRQRQASAQQFAQSMAMQQHMHDQFMQTMQEGHDQFMAQQQASMNARSTAASDWVDFALDRQTVINPNTGAAVKITNQVTVEQPLIKAHGDGTPW